MGVSEVMEKSFDILADEHRSMLTCYLKALVGDAHIAEDLAQDTFLAAYQSLDRFETGANFGAWLRGIARHKALDHQRTAARRGLVVDSRIVEGIEDVYTLFDTATEPTAAGAWADRLDRLRYCIGRLSDRLRESVERVYQNGLSLREAAEDLQSTPEAVGQRLTRARQQIRTCIELKLRNQDA